jgi:hypothetical protein
MYWPNFRSKFYRSFGTKNVGHYRLSLDVVSCSCSYTILIRGCDCKGWSKWSKYQHISHSIPHCTTNTDVNKTFKEIGSFACVNAEREQQHEDQCSGSSSLKPTYKYANVQDDACSTHRYCSMTVSSSVTFKEGTVPWQEITPCMTVNSCNHSYKFCLTFCLEMGLKLPGMI